jgi:biopolymer transport protein ExbD
MGDKTNQNLEKNYVEYEFQESNSMENTKIDSRPNPSNKYKSNNEKNYITIENPNSIWYRLNLFIKRYNNIQSYVILILVFLFAVVLYTKPIMNAPFLDSDNLPKISVNYSLEKSDKAIEVLLSGNHEIYLNGQFTGESNKLEISIKELKEVKENKNSQNSQSSNTIELKIRKIYKVGPFVFAGKENIYNIPTFQSSYQS